MNKYKSTNYITRKERDNTWYKIINSHILFIKVLLWIISQIKYLNLILSRVNLGSIVRDINITVKHDYV